MFVSRLPYPVGETLRAWATPRRAGNGLVLVFLQQQQTSSYTVYPVRSSLRTQRWGSLAEQPLPASSLNRNSRNKKAGPFGVSVYTSVQSWCGAERSTVGGQRDTIRGEPYVALT